MIRSYMWRVAVSPIAWIVPLMALAFGAGLGYHFGRGAALVGVVVGTLLGIAGAVAAYHFIVEKTAERREKELAERLERELSRPRPRAHRPAAGPAAPIAIRDGTGAVGIDVDAASKDLVRRAATDIDLALQQAEAMVRAHPRDGRVAGLHARLLLRDGQRSDAGRVGSDAIQMCVLADRVPDAVDILSALWEIRTLLAFEAGTAVALARALETSGEVAQARWCVEHASDVGAKSGDLAKARARLSHP